MTEELLKERVIHSLYNDFRIRAEVGGFHPVYQKRLRVDFLAQARDHLRAYGFTGEWFGIECKWSEGVDGQTSKLTKAVWQSITYAQSLFQVGQEWITPAFVTLYTPAHLASPINKHLSTLMQLALYGNVGQLYFYREGHWGIKFASIYSRRTDNAFLVNDKQLPKRRAGSL